MVLKRILGFSIAFSLFGFVANCQAKPLDLAPFTPAEYQYLAHKIFKNEANNNPRYLTHWNEGEDFPSLGIGHFIWLPNALKQEQVVFEETFPQMVEFVSQQSPPPKWLQALNPFEVPWKNKAEFEQAGLKIEMVELRNWLLETQGLQAEFIAQQFQRKWDSKITTLPSSQQNQLRQALNELMQTQKGLFVALDYYNFKGLGFNPKEQYQGEGWGLMDVLIDIPQAQDPQFAVNNFVRAAKGRLAQRVKNSPAERNESRWLKGWFVRLDNYFLQD